MLKKLLVSAVVLLAMSVQPAAADTILKFGLSEIGPDILYENGSLFTRDDGNAGTLGDQNTALNFTGFLDTLLTDISGGASFTLDSVTAVGGASMNGVLISQQTEGGTFSVWDASNNLLLSAELGEGSINGTDDVGTGSFFNTEVVNFTGGSLLNFVAPSPGGISLALASILTNGNPGLDVVNGVLQDFTANADGLITGEPVPEPSTVALLLSGLVGGVARRKKRKAAA